MKSNFSIVCIASVLTMLAFSSNAEEKLDPFFVPRPDFYGERRSARSPADEKENCDPASPHFIRQVGIDFKNVFTRQENLLILGLGLGASWAVSPLDGSIAQSGFSEQVGGGKTVNAVFASGTVLGSAAVQVGAAVATYGFGKLGSKPGVEALGRDLVRAQIVTQTLTIALKYATARERPDGSNNRSFPSGHSSTTFATATVLQRHYGWNIGIPAYIVASYVATSRLSEGRHYLSDVVFGAALGILAGRTVTVEIAKKRLVIHPMVVPAGAALQLTWISD